MTVIARPVFWRLKYLPWLLCGFLTLIQNAALADSSFIVLRQSAIALAKPDRVLLISVARAGHRLVAVGEHGAIVYSDDNGVTWRQAAVPVNIVVTTVAFATPQVGWAGADYGVVLNTTNGGASWVVQLTGDKVLALMSEAATKAVAASPDNPEAQRAERRSQIFSAAGPDKPFLTIAAFSSQKAIVFGAYRMAVETNDGGKTWTDISLQVGDPLSHNLYGSAWSGTSLFLAGEVGILLRSDDQGQTFSLLNSPTQSTFLGIMDAGGGAVFAYGVAGNAYRSTDNGQTWNPVNVATSADLTAATILPSGTIVLLAEDGHLFESNDHAATFTPVAGNQGMALFGAVTAANGNVVLVGSGGARVVPAAALTP